MSIIAFSGPGGTGKTTCAKKIYDTIIASLNIPSMVDYIRKQHFGENSKFSDKKSEQEIINFQNIILFSQFSNEKIMMSCCRFTPYIVTIERSSIDYAAYMLNHQIKNKKIEEQYVKRCIDHANKTYSGIVYFDPTLFCSSDDAKSSKERNNDSIKKTNLNIKQLLNKVDIPVLTLQGTTVNNRVNEILNFNSKLLK